MAGNNVVSPYTMRRRPIRGPMMNSIWGALFFVLGTGLGVTALMLFTTASPLNELKDQAGQVWWTMALMISPYPGLFIMALIFCGYKVVRSLIILAGTVVVTAYGLFQVGNLWFFAPRPINPDLLIQFPMLQWAGVAGTLILALVPGYLIGLLKDRVIKAAVPQDKGDGEGDFKIE